MRILILLLLTCFVMNAPIYAANTFKDETDAQNDTIEGKTLDEIVFVQQTVKHEANRDVFTVTKSLRDGASTAAQMLGRVQGMHYDLVSEAVSYMGSTNIKILVDSIEKDDTYVKNLSPKRFSRIEVIHNPAGKYREYNVIINLVTKQNYTGYELFVNESLTITPTENNGKGNNLNIWNNHAQATYTFNKWNFYATANYTPACDGTTMYNSTEYPLNGTREISIEATDNQPETIRKTDYRFLQAGADYRINNNNAIGFYAYYGGGGLKSSTDSRLSVVENADADPQAVDFHTSKRSKPIYTYRLNAFYQGKINLWNYNAGIIGYDSKNRWYNHTSRSTGLDIDDNRLTRYSWIYGYADAAYHTPDNKWSFALYTTQTWQRTNESRIEGGQTLARTVTNINSTEATAGWYPSDAWSVSANIGIQTINLHTNADNTTTVQPRLTLSGFHRFSPKTWLRFKYSTYAYTPPTEQTIGYGYFIDRFLWSGGNPRLKPSTPHSFNLSLGFFNKLTIEGSYTLTPNKSEQFYTSSRGMMPDGQFGPYAVESYINADCNNWSVKAAFAHQFKNLYIRVLGEVNGAAAKHKEFNNDAIGGVGAAGLQYFFAGNAFAAFQYAYDREIAITPQMRSTTDSDRMWFVLGKSFWKNRIEVSLFYTPPLHIASGKCKQTLTSQALIKNSWSNNQFRNDNQIAVNVRFNLSGGKQVRRVNIRDIDIK